MKARDIAKDLGTYFAVGALGLVGGAEGFFKALIESIGPLGYVIAPGVLSVLAGLIDYFRGKFSAPAA